MLLQRSDAGMPRAPAPPPFAADDTSLFFDFDGTLVELAETPDGIVVPCELHARLERLTARFPDRIGIVSGRSIAQIDHYLGSLAHQVALAGSHGAERRLPGADIKAAVRPEGLVAAEADLRCFADRHGGIVEVKSLGIALHYRARPDIAGAADALARTLADRHALFLQHGKMMVELRAPGDKGRAIAAMMATVPAMAGTCPFFFGDDITDEDGFRAAAAVGGAGVLIGDPRATDAAYGLPDVASLAAWIDTLLETS